MTASAHAPLRKSFAFWWRDQPAADVLGFATVLEEEYASLHPNEKAADASIHRAFVARDIADLAGISRALLHAQLRTDVAHSSHPWHPHPPAPASNPLTGVGDLVIRDQTNLTQLLRDAIASEAGGPAVDPNAVRDAIAARFTALLDEPLDSLDEFAEVLAQVKAVDDGTFAHRERYERSRILLEAAFAPFLRTTADRRVAEMLERIHAARHAALCLSGGGIRSASFAMGVVQGLARRGLLPSFHYLSTVSGGGYTGSWLSAWMARSGAHRVHEQLRGAHVDKPNAEPQPLRHIRTFSYYLTPQFGLMSADTWTLIATIARNILLIWLVLLPLMAAGLMLPRLFVAGPMTTMADWNMFGIDPAHAIIFLLITGTLLAVMAISFVLRHLYTYSGRDDHATQHPVTLREFLWGCLAPLVVAMVLLGQAWDMAWSLIQLDPKDFTGSSFAELVTRADWAMDLVKMVPSTMPMGGQLQAISAGMAFWVVVYVASWAIASIGRRPRLDAALLSIIAGATAGAIGGFASAQLFGLVAWKHSPEFFATFGVPLSLFGLLVAKQVVVGLASRHMSDAERESNARFSAWLLIAIVSWIVVVGLALEGPFLLKHFIKSTRRLIGLSGATGIISALVAASSSGSVASLGKSKSSGGPIEIVRRLVLAILTPVFAGTVIILISMFDGRILRSACDAIPVWCPRDVASVGTAALETTDHLIKAVDYASPQLVIFVMIGLATAGLALGRMIDTNRFSLHAMYRVRLVRTFLGASKPPGERQPNPFTGFDETDDMPIGDLWPARHAVNDEDSAVSHPPLHVINMALNTVGGTDLATQTRKATSFTVSALHAGSASVGYRRTSAKDGAHTPLYGGAESISLGTAMAVSGAAASPNMGYHSSPSLTFLMTLFNARLGWWLGNPGPAGRKTYAIDEPRLAVVPILDEMFGRTTDDSPYVYLSDGGHFENLGVYEMIRRRCRFIVVSDAGEDPKATFDDLGGAIRKARIDFGVPVDFDHGLPIYPRDTKDRPDASYWAVARIRYSQVDRRLPAPGETPGDDGLVPESDGVLLYLKPAFYGVNEPRDVFNYAKSQPEFPHEPTGNQFFGEAQFESYRALGEFVVDQACQAEFNAPSGSDETVPRATFEAWFRAHLDDSGATIALPATPAPTLASR